MYDNRMTYKECSAVRTIRLPLKDQTDYAPNTSTDGFGSWHAGICQFLLVDGAVRALDNYTSTVVLSQLGNARDGGTAGPGE